MNTNTVNIAVITSPCGCPIGDVCPDSSGVCPAGYTPDPSNFGCCAPQCAAQSCNPGQRWSESACQCLYIPVYSISSPTSYSTYLFYNLTFNDIGHIIAFGILPSGVRTCNGWFGNTGTTGNEGNDMVVTTRTYKFAVLDVNGNPIPNVPLKLVNDQLTGSYPITTTHMSRGLLSISTSLDGVTDSNGNGLITLTITFQPGNIPNQAACFNVVQDEDTAVASGNVGVIADNNGTGSVPGLLNFGFNLQLCLNWAAGYCL